MRFTKIVLMVTAFAALTLNLHAQDGDVKLESQIDSIAYALGAQLNQIFGEDMEDVNMQFMKQGALDAAEGKNALAGANMQALMQNYTAKKAEKKKTQADEWMAKNGQKEGITTTESGLQYEIIKKGTGASPSATDKVKVHYHGTLTNGSVFDSSVDRGEPIEFPLNGVIKGWTEGLQLMKTGAKYRFYIPPELGYGANGSGPTIGPYEVLIFDVELLDVVDEGGSAE